MIDVHFLDRIARQVTTVVEVDEKHTFDATLLNQMFGPFMEIRLMAMQAMLETKSSAPRFLFENTSLLEATAGFHEIWSSDFKELVAQPPLLVTLENARGWRKTADFARLTADLGGIGLVLKTKETDYIQGGKEYLLCVVRPSFPEWFVFTQGPHALSDGDRIEFLEIMEEAVAENEMDGNRLPADDISHLYFHFLREVMPTFYEAAQQNPTAQKIITNWMGLYSICGIEFSANTFHDLPDFYKEYAILFFQRMHTTQFIPRLKELVREKA